MILVLYESFFGNTRAIAESIGKGLGSPENTTVAEISSIDPAGFKTPELLIVGSATRGFRPWSNNTP